jgi:hypothetical protein
VGEVVKQVIIDVDLAEGTVEVEVKGVRGKLCELETKELQASLGGKIISHKHTHEYSLVPTKKVSMGN